MTCYKRKDAKAQRCSYTLCLCAFAFIILQLSCTENTPTKVHCSFYHWQTNLSINQEEQRYLDSLSVQKLYIKFFDIDWDFNQQQAIPHASLIVNADLTSNIEIVPTLFITNRTFQHIEQTAIDDLVNNVKEKLLDQFKDFPNHTLQAIQIDCDWSLSTKDKYFYFLKKLKEAYPQEQIVLSTTIRLHQIKYFKKTGIPPVHRGVLMFYNMGEVMEYDTYNSILDLTIAKKYTDFIPDYPLAIDLALPLFQWGVLFREGKMIQLINQLKASELSDPTRFQSIDTIRWKVIKSTYLNGLYLYEGDVIRIEKIEQKDLEETIQFLQPSFQGKEFELIFYHLEEGVLGHFSIDNLKVLLEQAARIEY